jgi:hypothetical protein
MKNIKFGKIEAIDFVDSQYTKEGQKSVHVRQPIKTVYTQQNEFNTISFINDVTGEYDSTRNTVIQVPDDWSLEQVQSELVKSKAQIGIILSNNPIISSKQKYAIENLGLEVEVIVERQLIPETEEGQPVLDNNGKKIPQLYMGRSQYRLMTLVKTGSKDIDLRCHEEENKDSVVTKTESVLDMNTMGDV